MSATDDDGPIDLRLAALEAEARAVFAQVRDADLAPDAAAIDRMVSHAIGAAPLVLVEPTTWPLRVLVIALVTVAGATAVAWLAPGSVAPEVASLQTHAGAAPAAIELEEAPSPSSRASATATPSVVAPPAPVVVDPPSGAADAELSADLSADLRAPSRRRRPRAAPALAGEEVALAVATPSAAELFARANAARDRREHADAEALYRRVLDEHAGTGEAEVASVNLGLLYLGALERPADALARFDGYLHAHPGGKLAERATVGKADALARLARTADERDTWEELLRRWPDSLHAPRAHRRIGTD